MTRAARQGFLGWSMVLLAALAVSALGQALLWWAVLQASGPSLLLASALMGMCAVPIITLHGAAMSALCGGSAVARALGFSYLIKLPFLAMSGVLVGAAVLFGMLLLRVPRGGTALRIAT